MMFRGSIALAGVFSALAFAACSDDSNSLCQGQHCIDGKPEPTGRTLTGTKIELTVESARAGTPFAVRCIALYSDMTEEKLDRFTTRIAPLDGASIAEADVTITKVGRYDLQCEKDGVLSKDAVSIDVGPGDPARVSTSLSPADINAGADSTASCQVEDAYGNAIADADTRVDVEPPNGVQVDDKKISGRRAGTYQVTCSVLRTRLEEVPATLTVISAEPIKVVTLLSQGSVKAGSDVTVSCEAEDAQGNRAPIEDPEFTVDPAAIGTINGGTITPEHVGDFSVTCHIAGKTIEEVAAWLRVLPGDPAKLEIVEVQPDKAVYARSELVTLVLSVHDAFDNEVNGANFKFLPNPASAVTGFGGNQVMLTGDGPVDLTVAIDGPTYLGQPVTDSVSFLIDGQAPEVIITHPTRAEMVVGQPGAAMTVEGIVTDAVSGVADLIINGVQINVGRGGHFSFETSPDWGINVIQGSVTDLAGNGRDFAQSYSYAAEYQPTGPNWVEEGKAADGVIAHLGAQAIDDDNPDVDDIARIGELAIANLDVKSLIPNPATTYNSDCSVWFVTITGALKLHVDNLTYGAPIIDARPINGGIHLKAAIPNLRIDMHTSGDVCDVDIGVAGFATASWVVVEGDVMVRRLGNGSLQVTMPNRNVQIYDLNIDLDMPSIIDWAIDGIISLFSGVISDAVESAFSDIINEKVPPLIQDFLSTFSIATGFDVPAPLSMHLDLGASLGMVAFDTAGGSIGLDSTIYATGAITPEPRGAIKRFTHSYPAFNTGRALSVALSWDLVNEALYAIWYGGGLDLDLTNLIGDQLDSTGNGNMSSVTATAKALLPPILAPSDDPQYPVELQIGDFQIQVHVDNVPGLGSIDVDGYVSAYATASVIVNPASEIELMLSPNTRLAIELTTPLDEIISQANLLSFLETGLSQFLPQIFSQLIKSIPLPSFDVSAMAGGYLPPGIVLGIGNAQTRFHSSYLVLDGDIVQKQQINIMLPFRPVF